MRGKTRKSWLYTTSLVIASLSLIFYPIVQAQDPPQEDERRLWDSEFLKKRTTAKTPSPARKPTGYKRVTPKENKPTEKSEGEMIGITIWRMRQSKQSDNQVSRILLEEEENKQKVEWTLERVESDTVFASGDRVRLSIESPRDGYLYVIDRELYIDGTMSDPYLIYPTLKNRGGNNSVSAGKVIELPGGSAFRLSPLKQDYAGEVLTVLVTPKPLPNLSIGRSMVKLDKSLVEGWEKQWSASVERFELIGGAGKPYTKAEKEAGQEGARLLTQEDEMPQTLYRLVTVSENPLVIKIPLRIKK